MIYISVSTIVQLLITLFVIVAVVLILRKKQQQCATRFDQIRQNIEAIAKGVHDTKTEIVELRDQLNLYAAEYETSKKKLADIEHLLQKANQK
jgi:septal ring factor EnvC (AmiA/AmiB activator)